MMRKTLSKFPFLDLASDLLTPIFSNVFNYDKTSCLIISRICRAGALTCDSLLTSDNLTVSDIRNLNSFWQAFLGGQTAFYQMSLESTGPDTITISSQGRAILNTFTNWDSLLQSCPFSDIGIAMSELLTEVTP